MPLCSAAEHGYTVRRRQFYSVAEVFFSVPPVLPKTDIVYYHQLPAAVPGARFRRFGTLILDLRLAPRSLIEDMRQTTRYEIRRADSKDALTHYPPRSDEPSLTSFTSFYNRSARLRGGRQLSPGRLRNLHETGLLHLTSVFASTGEALAWHAYVATQRRARLLHSASRFRETADSSERALVGRANRWLHWRDILAFQASGQTEYDFGGYLPGGTDPQALRVAQFKSGFGGTVVVEYNGAVASSLRGRVVVGRRSVRSRARTGGAKGKC